jgi:hypothetical protein
MRPCVQTPILPKKEKKKEEIGNVERAIDKLKFYNYAGLECDPRRE